MFMRNKIQDITSHSLTIFLNVISHFILLTRAITANIREKPITSLAIASILYVFIKSSLFLLYSGQEQSRAELHFGNFTLLGYSAFVFVGCLGEAGNSSRWSAFHKIFPIWVAIGVAGEFLADAVVYDASEKLQKQTDEIVSNARTIAKDALGRAADAETKATNLLKENMDLERDLAPRLDFNQFSIVKAISALPRVPIFIMHVDKEEPKQLSEYLYFSFAGVKIEKADPWSVKVLPPNELISEGITLEYRDPSTVNLSDHSSKDVAIAICESLKSEDISVSTRQILNFSYERELPDNIPNNAVIILVGVKPNHRALNKQLRAKGMMGVPDFKYCTFDELHEEIDKDRAEHPRAASPKQ